MSLTDLTFYDVTNAITVYDPLEVSSSVNRDIQVTNYGSDHLTNLGIYLIPSSSTGDLDNPSGYTPATDYQDVLTWGSDSDAGTAISGGIKLGVPQTDGSTINHYITRSYGATISNKIPLMDLDAGGVTTITVRFENQPSAPARKLLVDLAIG